ncbi:hypothetical protein SNE40_005905 [Patella caerulea]|uniref:Mutator-like transposase domain-containing protein n=1 Tax=Patella caerulea TaxID=87958 RepID=A0AAN8QAK5_PATCE
MVEMWNSVIQLHAKGRRKACAVSNFQLVSEQNWGAGWMYSVKCTKCSFISPVYKLYKEIPTGKPGRKAAVTNLTLQSGLLDMPVGNTRARSGVQTLSNQVSAKMRRLNTVNMREKNQSS